jgi:tRNA(fMet)-specific endonuclease VapC
MAYLIDSDWVIDYLEEVPAAVQLIRPMIAVGVSISIVSYIEVYQGVYRTQSAEVRQGIEEFLQEVLIVPLSVEIARRCAQLREILRQRGRRVHNRALDLIIAATALEHDLTLVTRNTDDYRDIPGLKLYR